MVLIKHLFNKVLYILVISEPIPQQELWDRRRRIFTKLPKFIFRWLLIHSPRLKFYLITGKARKFVPVFTVTKRWKSWCAFRYCRGECAWDCAAYKEHDKNGGELVCKWGCTLPRNGISYRFFVV
jgi:hypothetical protein